MPERRQSIGERVFRQLQRWLPSEFRGDFGDAMLADAHASQASWWTREIPGLIAAIAREHTEGVRQDLKYARRQLAATPGFTIAAVIMLAVGTGSNAAMFSVIDAVVVRPAFRDPARVVEISKEREGKRPDYRMTPAELKTLQRSNVFSAVSGWSGRLAVLTGAADTRRIGVDCVSAAMFDVLDVRPVIGRAFGADDDRPGASPVAVISNALWRRDFGSTTDAIGRTITLDGRPTTIIGVMPRGFLGVNANNTVEVMTPLEPAVAGDASAICRILPDSRLFSGYARVRAPLTATSAAAAINERQLLPSRIRLERTDATSYDDFQRPLTALLGAVACVLLIACANVANLQLERLSGRRRELAMRLALGASRGRVMRQTVIENLLLSGGGVIAGLITARLTLGSITSMMPPTLPNVGDVTLDGRVMAITIVVAVVAGLIVGLVPAVHMLRAGAALNLRTSERTVAGGAHWLKRSLVVTEVALSVALLIGAGLMVRTFWTLRPTALGFTTSGRTTTYTLLNDGWRVQPGHLQFVNDVIERFEAIPGVTSASASSYLPMSGYTATSSIRIGNATAKQVWTAWVTEHFLRDMDVAITRGRDFNGGDVAGAPPVAIINETFARQHFPNADPIGQRVEVDASADLDSAPRGAVTTRLIVGVARDMREGGRDRIQRPELYAPYAQEPGPALLYFVLRTDGAAPAQLSAQIQAAIGAARPGQLAERIETMDALVNRSVSRPRFGAWLFGTFAAIAVGLSTLGLGAVVAWWVAQRRREIGIRMALGSTRTQVAHLVVKQGLTLALIGIALGGGAAAVATRLLAEWLYGVAPNDAPTFIVCSACMLIVAIAAAYVPARRAARIDPAITLKTE